MGLKLYNTLTRAKQEFTPADPKDVRMYVCGPTVYDRPHIGNARSVVVYDVLYRLLKHLYPQVTYVRNITDVDDKINAAAKANGEPISALTDRVTKWFHDDMQALNVLPATLADAPVKNPEKAIGKHIEPKATSHISQMLKMIERLISNGNAYVSEGHVLFDTKSEVSGVGCQVSGKTITETRNLTPYTWHYGMLSGRIQDDLESGARVKVESYKKNPGDFVLWKPANPGDDASSVFDSPWGAGRPGWHIECSAMSTHYLGENFDLHGGGVDLMFPHHENEIAQSCCAFPGSHFAKYWVHNGFLTVNGEKMSKSLGNFVTVKDLLDKGVRGEVIRWALLSNHYRKPLDWTENLLQDSAITLKAIADGIVDTPQVRDDNEKNKFQQFLSGESDYTLNDTARQHLNNFIESLCDDLNISKAEAILHELHNLARGAGLNSAKESYALKAALKIMCDLLGLDILGYRKKRDEEAIDLYKQLDVEDKINARITAKKAKNWAEADRIRGELKAAGILLEDRPDGTTDWRRE